MKYSILEDNFVVTGKTKLYRIMAEINIKDENGNILVKKGEIGGYVASERNLSQSGSCWIYDESVACENATVAGSAIIRGNSSVKDNATVNRYTIVENSSIICENATVDDLACISTGSIVRGKASVRGHAKITKTEVTDNAFVGGLAEIENARIQGNTEIHGDVTIKAAGNAKTTITNVIIDDGGKLRSHRP